MTPVATGARLDRGLPSGRLIGGAIVLAAAAGAAVAVLDTPPVAVVVAVAVLLVSLIAARPVVGAWLWLAVGPLIVGIARGGSSIPLLRPNEALLLIAIAGVGLHCLWRFSRRETFLPKLGSIDAAVTLLMLTGSVAPLLLRYGRELPVSQDDVLYAFVFAKYFVLFALFRIAVRTEADVATALRLALASGAVVAVVAILQVKGLFNVAGLLNAYYDAPFEATVGPIKLRATSTVASSFGLADMMAMCLAVVLAWLSYHGRPRALLIAAGALFFAGCVAAGSFSGFIGCAVVVFAIGIITRRMITLLAMLVPTGIVATAIFWPVIAARLDGFDSRLALPRSWIGRLDNLERFFWPELFSNFNWLWGVRPAARVLAPETWRTWVYIESGHTWLLWTGGVPLFLAFIYFTWVVVRDLSGIARSTVGPKAVSASAAVAATAMIFVLMAFDPHLTVRGSADLFFPLVALSLVSVNRGGKVPDTVVSDAGAAHRATGSAAA
jgi:hypothetical protein